METFQLIKQVHVFTLTTPGEYTISFIGGFHLKTRGLFKCEIKEIETETNVVLKEIFWKRRFHHNTRKAIEFYKFTINTPGQYQITFHNIEDLEMDESMLFFKRKFWPAKILKEQIAIIIK